MDLLFFLSLGLNVMVIVVIIYIFIRAIQGIRKHFRLLQSIEQKLTAIETKLDQNN